MERLCCSIVRNLISDSGFTERRTRAFEQFITLVYDQTNRDSSQSWACTTTASPFFCAFFTVCVRGALILSHLAQSERDDRRTNRGSVSVVLTTAPQRPGEASCSTSLPAHPQMINPCLSFSQMGKTSQPTLQSRKASALGVAANARRRLHMRTDLEQAHPAGTSPPFDLGSTDFGDPLEAMATCGETMRTGEVLLEGDCLDGILAPLTAKALCRVMRTPPKASGGSAQLQKTRNAWCPQLRSVTVATKYVE